MRILSQRQCHDERKDAECRMLSSSLKLVRLVVVLCVGSCTPLVAQTTSVIEGYVKDQAGLPLPTAEVKVASPVLASERIITSDQDGFFRVVALPPGTYVVSASHPGFAPRIRNIELTVNRTLHLDIQLEVGTIKEAVTIIATDESALADPTSSTTGGVVTPLQIESLPVNGRDYLDLMQLIPGVSINRQADKKSDAAVPVLGERGGNTNFLIDGFSNQDSFAGGASAQFNQETIAEFQVLTTGYKAEFGNASGGVVNVVTKSGGNAWHGLASLFHRNNAFDSSNVPGTSAPHLLRWNYSLALGGPVIKDRVFFFTSAERIREVRRLNFVFPANTPQILRSFETQFDDPNRDFETRLFGKLDEHLGRHHLTQQMNLTDGHENNFLPLSAEADLPSTRRNTEARRLLLGASDTALFGDKSNPWVLSLRGQYRSEPSSNSPSHPEAGPNTFLSLFSSLTTGQVFGDLGDVSFGSTFTTSRLDQRYTSLSANLAKYVGSHGVKFGWEFLQSRVNGLEADLQNNQLFATASDFARFGPINSGFFSLNTTGGAGTGGSLIKLRNSYDGLFFQDDWKIRSRLTLNLGLRWDYDSTFNARKNFSPRLGFAWSVTRKAVVRGSWGVFYDHFRLGLARDIPGFGGADIRSVQPFSYPRLFYGVPTIAPILVGLCLSPTLTDAQIASSGGTCPFGPLPFIGVDRLNRVVATGHAPISADAVVAITNVQALTGLSPQSFLDQASVAVGQTPGFFFWGPFGVLSHPGAPDAAFPVTVDPSFATPFTRSFNVGVQFTVKKGWVLSADYYHKSIRNILGVRITNLAFESRLPGKERTFLAPNVDGPVNGYGPWYRAKYDAVIFGFNKRFGARIAIAGNYTYANEQDNALCSALETGLGISSGGCWPSDSFIGVPPVVTEAGTGRTNANAAFVASNGNPVPRAGVFYNGPDLDRGPSDFSVKHAFLFHGRFQLPGSVELSGIFRAQSGFHFSRRAAVPIDVDGNQGFNGVDLAAGRNAFTAPPYVNIDLRVGRAFKFRERVTVTPFFEFFNLFNRRNPAAVQRAAGREIPFGSPLQVLPGREGQVGLRVEF